MLYVNQKLLKEIPEHLKGVMEYHPDVLLFEFNQTQYTYFWQRVASAKYWYTNGYEIRPTNWFMYVFQLVKGWGGLKNNCHPEKITYTLDKLAYYGYTKQFTQPDFSSLPYSLSPEICNFSSQNRDDKITERLQKKLIANFFKLESHFNTNYSGQSIYSYHRFGDSWKNIDKMELIPALDPQDNNLIAELVREFDKKGYSPSQLNFRPKSKYARAAADYNYDQFKKEYDISRTQYWFQRLLMEQLLGYQGRIADYLAKALTYDPEIVNQDPQTFISYYIDKKEYSKAFNLLDLLSDPNLAMELFKKIPESELPSLIGKSKPNTKIAAIIARVYIENKEYEAAKKYFTDIEQLNPLAAIYLEIQKNNYSKAYDVFEKYQEGINLFPCSERTRLAKIFSEGSEITYNTGKTLREAKRWREAEQWYLLSLNQKKAAYQLSPSQTYRNEIHTHRRLYALLLIDADIDLHNPETSELQNIQKGITLLKECQSSEAREQDLKNYALARGLMRQIDTLREKISLDELSDDSYSLAKHKIQHQKEINRLIKTLEELILLLKGTTDQEQRIMLGKAHYLLADVQLYFDINSPNINDNYRMAKEVVPNNPFYLLRISEIFEQEKEQNRDMAISKLKKIGFTVFDYYHWSEERWCKRDAIIYTIKDIHQISDDSRKSELKGNLLSYLI